MHNTTTHIEKETSYKTAQNSYKSPSNTRKRNQNNTGEIAFGVSVWNKKIQRKNTSTQLEKEQR